MAAVAVSECCEMIVMSSAYVMIVMSGVVGIGMSCVKRLKREGESTDPWGTPFV